MEKIQFSDEYFMKQALAEAKKAFDADEVPIGAVIVCGNKIIARAHNLTERLRDGTAHAEMQAFTSASEYLGGKFLDECTLYVTLEPCLMCASAISEAKIGKLYFGAYDEKKGAIESIINIYNYNNFFIPEVYGGIKEIECSLLLKNFFSFIRKKDEKKT